MIYKICVDSVAGDRAAKGAGRIASSSAAISSKSTTPSRGMMRQARAVAGMALNVIIRPRGGDFLFDDDEFSVTEADIDTAREERADGVVIGLLTADAAVTPGARAI